MFVKVTVYRLLKLTEILRVEGLCVSGLTLNKKTNLYSDKRGKKTEESPFVAKQGISQSNRTEIHSEVRNSKYYEMQLESKTASTVLTHNSSRINSSLAVGKSSYLLL